jgi:hypothetical protein
MWEPQPLTTLRASKACREENFTSTELGLFETSSALNRTRRNRLQYFESIIIKLREGKRVWKGRQDIQKMNGVNVLSQKQCKSVIDQNRMLLTFLGAEGRNKCEIDNSRPLFLDALFKTSL